MLGNKGQAIVEYVLLIFVAVSIAALIIRGVASRDQSNPGVVIKAWQGIIEAIAFDSSD